MHFQERGVGVACAVSASLGEGSGVDIMQYLRPQVIGVGLTLRSICVPR